MYNFFVDVYQHFFDVVDEEQMEEPPYDSASAKKLTKLALHQRQQTDEETHQEGFTQTPKANKESITSINTVAYPQGTVNPLLKETIRRVISIDSQFRDKTLYPYPYHPLRPTNLYLWWLMQF